MTTCKNCGEEIDRRQTGYWLHTETRRVMCKGRETQAEEAK